MQITKPTLYFTCFYEQVRGRGIVLLLAIALVLLLCARAHAQYHFDSWTTDNGLPQNAVLGITQTRDGYLWFSTLDGLIRYDGVKFTIYNKTTTPELLSNRFATLYEDRSGVLWIAKEDGGIVTYAGGKFKSYGRSEGVPIAIIKKIEEDRAGNIYFYTNSENFKWQQDRFVPYLPPPTQALFFYPSSAGTRWYLDKTGMYEERDGHKLSYSLPSPFSDIDVITASFQDRSGALWVASDRKGLFRFHNGTVKNFNAKDGLPVANVLTIFQDRDGIIWLGTEGGLVRYQQEKFITLTKAEGLSDNSVVAIYQDREGSIWLGTQLGGINRMSRHIITPYGRKVDGKLTSVYPILEDHTGRIWLGGNGIYSGNTGVELYYGRDEGLVQYAVTALYEDSKKNLWIGTAGGLFMRVQEKFIDVSDKLGLPVGNYNVFAIKEDRAGNLWFGTDKGLVKVSHGVVAQYQVKDGLAGEEVKVILEDRAGNLWFGTYNGLSCLRAGRFHNYRDSEGLVSAKIRSLYEDESGTLWIGTYDGGLARLQNGKIDVFTEKDGLFNNGVFQILEDRRGNFWISCNRGIYRVSKKQLEDFAAGRARALTCTAFGKPDGMIISECNGGSQPAGIRARDGRLWFPTQAGAAVIDPESIAINSRPPPVVIERCLLDQDESAFDSGLKVLPDKENIEIQYTGLSFIKPENMRFRYRLAGIDRDWVEAGGRRVANYAHLPPGEYLFQVIAANSDGIWNERGAALKIIIIPPFWRTWWFSTVVMLTMIALAAFFYQRRIALLKKANAAQAAFTRKLIESQENERKRIAAELHDSLGQHLIVIKNLALMILQQSAQPDNMNRQVDEISREASQAISEVREISYNLRPYQLDRLGLTKAIQSIIKKVSASSAIAIRAEIDDIDELFSKESEINLYRIVQECINNILKHSAAANAQVIIKNNHHQLRITIADDGRGFEPAMVGAREGQPGFGLTGISERAGLLNGKTLIDSVPGQGTTVTITIPIRSRAHD